MPLCKGCLRLLEVTAGALQHRVPYIRSGHECACNEGQAARTGQGPCALVLDLSKHLPRWQSEGWGGGRGQNVTEHCCKLLDNSPQAAPALLHELLEVSDRAAQPLHLKLLRAECLFHAFDLEQRSSGAQSD